MLTRTAKPTSRVLVFVNKQNEDVVALVKRMCNKNDFYVEIVYAEHADQAMIDQFMITSLPACVFTRQNQWTYIMPHVTEHTLADMVAYIQTK